MNPTVTISVIIPALNEEARIGDSVRSAQNAGAYQIIVCDGGSRDETVIRAKQAGAIVVSSEPGRGIQQNTGAKEATGQILLFLHADCRLGESILSQVASARDRNPGPLWGAFRQRILSDRWIYRALEWGNAARVIWRKLPFGDQAIFVDRETFDSVGGCDNVPLMEDVRLSKKLSKRSKPHLLNGPVFVDHRRWQQRGVVNQTLLNWKIQWAHSRGVSEQELARWYRCNHKDGM
jgi:rSAM/selenodomain-associated transferase 2